jgi:hypothetical protein
MYTNRDFILKRCQKNFIIEKMPEDVMEKLWEEFDQKFNGGNDNDEEREWLENKCIALFKELNIVIPFEEELEKLEAEELAKS